MTLAEPDLPAIDASADCEALDRDGVVALRGAFAREWVERLREDMMTAFWEAIQRPGGAVGRGPRRWYVEIHPQAFGGFADLCAHPWVTAMCSAALGPEYRIVEIGFDTPFEGAMNQPWHRDFPSPPETWRDRRITSLAFNLTGVDVTPDMGPFEIAVDCPQRPLLIARQGERKQTPEPARGQLPRTCEDRGGGALLPLGAPPQQRELDEQQLIEGEAAATAGLVARELREMNRSQGCSATWQGLGGKEQTGKRIDDVRQSTGVLADEGVDLRR